jgi:predicted metal-binding membrane protein
MGMADETSLRWFLGVWVVMMAAMMLPSAAPTVGLYARMSADPVGGAAFSAGYLLTWAVVGVAAYALVDLVPAWEGAGRWVAGGALVLAAAYELTPLKDACLTRCRNPVGFLMTNWREGRHGALRMGALHGAWCAGCCWALMAALLALGVMSVGWMAFVAALIALERVVPGPERLVTGAVALVLVGAGVVLVV